MRDDRVTFLTLLLLVGATIAPQAEQSAAETDRVDNLIGAEMRRQRIPGLSLVVLRQGEIIKASAYGVADRALKLSATPETVYKIASVSKLFIATGISRSWRPGGSASTIRSFGSWTERRTGGVQSRSGIC